MWKLTIYQAKKYETRTSEQEVSVKNKDITVLTGLMEQMANCKTETEIRFEITKEEDCTTKSELEEVPAEELAEVDEMF